MSELIQNNDNRATIRWKLLTGVSALALASYVSTAAASAEEIEPSDNLDRTRWPAETEYQSGQENFSPEFPNSPPRPSVFAPSQRFEHPPRFSIDGYAALAFQPQKSDWQFSASVKFGRSASKRRVHNQTHPEPFIKYYYTSNPSSGSGHISRRLKHNVRSPIAAKFADTNARIGEHHLVLDFQAGKEVGLGMFGNAAGSSVVNLGVRFAQFSSQSNISIKSNPDWGFYYKYNFPATPVHHSTKFAFGENFHSNSALAGVPREFHGVGPSLSWNAWATGNMQDGQIALDWGVNAALLFGRQRAEVQHQTTGRYHNWKYQSHYRKITYQPAPFDQTRSRSITVPNVGGSLGISYRMEDFKVSFGYRADLFMNAIDGGIDTRKNEKSCFLRSLCQHQRWFGRLGEGAGVLIAGSSRPHGSLVRLWAVE